MNIIKLGIFAQHLLAVCYYIAFTLDGFQDENYFIIGLLFSLLATANNILEKIKNEN